MYQSTIRPFCLVVLLLLAACSGNQSSAVRPSRPSGSGIVITAEDIDRLPGSSLEQILLTRVPGLTMARTEDGRRLLRLRGGGGSILGDNEVLIVVNGIALSPFSSGNLNAINPRDIESITVIQDAASTAAYGVRGVNGVILIKTKHG